jgi:hypothetical protein
VVLLLVSAALASRPGEEDRIEIVDPSDPTKTIFVEEKYPGESQWLSQIATAENQMREQGRIDKDGHLKNGKDPKKAKKHDQ